MTNARIRDISEFVLDGTHASPVRTEIGIPVLSAQNVNNGVLNFETDRYTSDEEYQAFKSRLQIRNGDLLLTIVGSIGRAAVVTDVPPLVFQRSVAVIRPRQGLVDSRYLFHVTQARRFQAQLARSTNQSSQAGVYLGKLEEVVIPLPPLTQQRRIAEILDKVDGLRAKRRAALAQLDTLTQSIFLDLFGDPATNSLGLPIEPLGNCLLFVTSGSRGWAEFYSPTGSRFIRSLDVQMNHIGNEDVAFVVPPDNAEARRTRVMAGDVLLTITGSRIGRVAPVPTDLSGAYISQHVAILRVDSKRIEPNYLSFFLSLDAGGQRQIAREQYGQTKPGLNFDQIRRFQVPVPQLSLQREFARRVAAVGKLKHFHRASLAELDSLFASIQHRAFRGKM